MEEITLSQLLDAREKRAGRQRELLCQYGQPLLCLTMNIPGPVKRDSLIERGFHLGLRLLLAQLQGEGIPLLHREQVLAPTGCEGYMVAEGEALRLKELAAQVEDAYPWTRLLDIDVLTPEGGKLSREDLGLPPRTCLLCHQPAMVCARSRNHGLPALIDRTKALLQEAVQEDTSRLCGTLAARALLFEVCAAPKPGLVDRLGRGSHKDMDIFTFMESTAALQPYFSKCARVGMETAALSPAETFSRLRLVGKEAEFAMLQATVGINTHKGAIFILGLLCGCLGRLPRECWTDTEKLFSLCAQMTDGITHRELEGDTGKETPGKTAYRLCGTRGARGQAEEGFPAVKNVGLPMLKESLNRGFSKEEASCHALLHIMAQCGDTNLVARGGVAGAEQAVKLVQELLEKDPFPTEEAIKKLEKIFTEKNLSPGGSADLLAASWFVLFLSGEHKKQPKK